MMGQTFFDSIVARTETGYTTLKSVVTMEKGDLMPSYFLAETLKYLYVLFAPDLVLDSDKVVLTRRRIRSDVRGPKSPSTDIRSAATAPAQQRDAARKQRDSTCDPCRFPRELADIERCGFRRVAPLGQLAG
jgi:hypothetical protein